MPVSLIAPLRKVPAYHKKTKTSFLILSYILDKNSIKKKGGYLCIQQKDNLVI